MFKKRQFNRLLQGGFPLLMGILLTAVLGFSTAQAQVTVKYDSTYVPLGHTMTTYGDSAKYKIMNLKLIETGAASLKTGDPTMDSLQIKPPTGWSFVSDSLVTVTASQTRATGVAFDTTGFFVAFDATQTSTSLIKVKPNGAGYLSFRIGQESSVLDTIVITGLYVQSAVTVARYDSTTFVNVTVDTLAGADIDASALCALPGALNSLSFVNAPNASQTAGKYITSVATGSAAVDTANGVKVFFLDAASNLTPYNSTAPTVSVLLHGTSTPGNGILSGNTTVVWYPYKLGVNFGSMRYTKAEATDIKFAVGSKTLTTSGTITFASGAGANISVSGNKTSVSVDGTVQYTLTLTDANFNPVSGSTLTGSESTISHGGTFAAHTGGSDVTNANGVATIDFSPSKFFVGKDTVKFTDGASASQTSPLTITPTSLGGVIIDYAGTASGAAVTEDIAAGVTVYVRGFLRDVYGNPINATAISDVSFAINGVNGKNMALGTAVLTNPTTESQYVNINKTAVAVAIPYTVSSKVSNLDSVLVSAGSYSGTVTIQNRSGVPATMKMVQTTGTDSSIVASNYANSIAFTDTLWDSYGNKVTAPGTVTVAPLKSSYAVYFSTDGLTKFVRTADTTAADTIYPASGIVSRTVFSGKTAGISTFTAKLAADAAVTQSVGVYVTPAAYSKLVMTPDTLMGAIAGQSNTFMVEKQDAYGNHIDFGLSGAEARGNTGAFTKPSAGQITSDSTALVADTVSGGHNLGGHVTKTYTKTGSAGVASVGGTLNVTFPFISYTAGADTQKIYASLSAKKDTSIVYSQATGDVKSFTAVIAAADSLHNVGDSVKVVVTAYDSSSYRVYSYNAGGHAFTLNHTSFSPVTSKDTTYYFSYMNTKGHYVKSTGSAIADSVFNQGQATIYLHKFVVDSANTVSISGGGLTATASQAVTWKPLNADASFGFWSVVASKDTLNSFGAFTFTVTPRDMYYNTTLTPKNIIANVSLNTSKGAVDGNNPRVINGATVFTGTLSGVTGASMDIYVFNSDNSSIFGSTTVAINQVTAVDQADNTIPKVYSLAQNYPNPFNPSTIIRYELPKAGLVTLKVYDILGREVASLVNKNQDAGKYSIQFNASALASGVYIYRIHSDNFTAVKKLMLLK